MDWKKKKIVNPHDYYRIDPTTNCWIWLKGYNSHGYGYFRFNGQRLLAHRYFYEERFGKITAKFPDDVLDHVICNNRKCCNPEHVKLTSISTNWHRYEKKLKDCCRRGHKYTEENTYWYRGNRICRVCKLIQHKNKMHIRTKGGDRLYI